MKRLQFTLLILLNAFLLPTFGQSPTVILNNVDTISSGGATGALAVIDPSAVPLVSSRPCFSALRHFSVANSFGSGAVVVVGHEAILSNNQIGNYDNLTFIMNAIDWITPGINKRVSLLPGWINMSNSTTLQSQLQASGYTFGSISGPISAATLANTDILILGNDWNGQVDYSTAELDAIETFVSNGGGLLIAGLGWSYPGGLNSYPMNSAAKRFGIEFTTSTISDPVHQNNGSPLLYNLYPDNLDTTDIYCPSVYFGTNLSRGDSLRVLRLAVSTNGEFTQQSGGVVATTSLIGPWLEVINETYGREFCVRFELIPNNNLLIFPDSLTDPWATLPPGSGGCTNAGLILSDQQRVIDSIIGAANYDISHVIAGSPFGGGCAGSFTSGVSGGFNIPVTRHEMGHQLGQSHTINNSGQNNYEPASGRWTIQGGNGQGHAHAVSFHQTALNLAGTNAGKGTKVATGNNLPQIQLGSDVHIPISTPFTIAASASDNDPNDTLTFVWDNMSPGEEQTIPIMDDSQGALFWRLLPGLDSSRTFPQMSDVISNVNANSQEQLPTQARVMDIRVTVNDNHRIMYQGEMIAASGTASDDIRLTVAPAGPFEVTSQDMPGIVYAGLSQQQITWNVNGTDTLPINTQFVEISLSEDGGYTYPYVLEAMAPNNGSATVQMPNINTTTARIKVAAVGNIYFDLNLKDFEIQETITGLEDAAFPMLTIYPNPAKDKIYLNGLPETDVSVKLFDLQGRLLQSAMNTDVLHVNDLAAGPYLIRIEAGDKRESRLVVVE